MLSQRQKHSFPHRRVCADWGRGAGHPAVRAFLGVAGAGRRGADSAGIAAHPEIGGKKDVHARDLRESAQRASWAAAAAGKEQETG